MHSLGKPWFIETPALQEGRPNLFDLPEYRKFREQAGVIMNEVVQCPYGGVHMKPSRILSNVDFKMTRACPHPKQWYAIPWSGQAIHTQHPPIQGRQLAVKWDDWSHSMLASEEPAGPYISKASAL